MGKFPVDAPKRKVIKTLEILNFQMVRQREHISMIRENVDGSKTPLTLPNQTKIKASTLDGTAKSPKYDDYEFVTCCFYC